MTAPISMSLPSPWVHSYLFFVIFPSLDWEPVWGPLTHGVSTFFQPGLGARVRAPLPWSIYLLSAWARSPCQGPSPMEYLFSFSLSWEPMSGPLAYKVALVLSAWISGNSAWQFCFLQAGSHIQTLMGSQSLQHRSREQQPYEGNINKVTIQQFQSPLPIQIPSSQASRGPQPGRCLIQTKGQRSMDGYPEQVRGLS